MLHISVNVFIINKYDNIINIRKYQSKLSHIKERICYGA